MIAFCRCFSWAKLLKQLLQLQLLQNSPFAKQSQYLKWEVLIIENKAEWKIWLYAIRWKKTTLEQKGKTYNFKQADFVQLHGFLGRTPEASKDTWADELESRRSPWLIFDELNESNLSSPWFCFNDFSSLISVLLNISSVSIGVPSAICILWSAIKFPV